LQQDQFNQVLFKYVNKGPDRATLKISNNSTESDKSSIIDEIKGITIVGIYHHVKQLGEYLLLTFITNGLVFKD